MVRYFSLTAAHGFRWETNSEFYAWTKAMKGKKAIQGKGIFHRVSGSKPAKGEFIDVEIIVCPVHQVEEMVTWGPLLAPPAAWRQVPGSKYAILVEGGERLYVHSGEPWGEGYTSREACA